MSNGLWSSEVREPSRQLMRLLLVFLCVGALVMILQILTGNSSDESGRFLVSLAAAGVATLVY
ncbi:MAG: hypothetical protein M3R23_04550, partial [Actinomycetota bacterium]|nr:hypothetical protein [Actinomycetota bacterium]